MPKTGSTFTSKVLNKVLKKYNYLSDVVNIIPDGMADGHEKEFVAVTMRNPCDMYLSLAHYGGAPGHVARPYYPSWQVHVLPSCPVARCLDVVGGSGFKAAHGIRGIILLCGPARPRPTLYLHRPMLSMAIPCMPYLYPSCQVQRWRCTVA